MRLFMLGDSALFRIVRVKGHLCGRGRRTHNAGLAQEPQVGIESMTARLRIECSTAPDFGSGASRNRAYNLVIENEPRSARDARPRYEWITSCRSNMPTNCSIFFARVSARFTVWIRNRMAYRFDLFRVAKNAFAFGCASSAR
jgi:hypothetical protein